MTSKQLAELLLLAAKIKEESWDEVKGKYNISLVDAITIAKVPEDWNQIVYFLLILVWNDALAWSTDIVQR